ncbi:MAG: hypothetical protein KAU24_00035 [Candidatus Aenigmarchaeota archaeon]|nr:hypothetical protein [Candidatus Aenigmarchaeota archaeon]
MGKKLQAAFEYLVIVSIVLVFMIPIWAYVTSTQRDTSTELALTYAKNTANQIADASNLVYSQGPPAKVKINVYIPYGVDNITILNSTIRFRLNVDSGITDIFAFSTAQLNGTLPKKQGYYWIEVEATDDIVQIEQSSF